MDDFERLLHAYGPKQARPQLEVKISQGISKSDAIRILEKIIIKIDKGGKIPWFKESNNYLAVLLEKTESFDGIWMGKQDTLEHAYEKLKQMGVEVPITKTKAHTHSVKRKK